MAAVEDVPGMNVVKAIRDYIKKMVSEQSGMKVLLLDEHTTSVVSIVYSQSEILQKEVYLIDRVNSTKREAMPHMKAICFVQPSESSIEALVKELKNPKYGQYDLYFANILRPVLLEKLAEADEHEVVREVQEFFGDYQAINPHLFSFDMPTCIGESSNTWRRSAFEAANQGLCSVLLSLKKRPVIRYAAASTMCKRLAEEVSYTIQKEPTLFDFRQQDVPPLLMVLDRRDDPITPLLNQWTYQAMVHELLGIKNNRVDLSGVPGISKELREIVLSSGDEFFTKNMYLNFGEIGGSIRTLVDEFQTKTKSHENIESIADMKAFVENYPQFRALSGNVSKHVSVVGELSRLVDKHDLLNLSETEQELACQSNHSECVQSMRQLLGNAKVMSRDKARLVMLYALRYEKHGSNCITEFRETLKHQGVSDELCQLVRMAVRYAGAGVPERSSDLFGTKGAVGFLKSVTGGLKGVDNIYTQHSPLLATTLDQLAKGKLKDSMYPYVDRALRDRPQEVIVFMVGGCTYEEAKAVAEFNEQNLSTMRVILGGTTVHNFDSFADEVRCAVEGGAPRGGAGPARGGSRRQ
eukprot:m.46588 g.46588  ORF g.46588 m.46588 type:complete len:581 (-) comp11870_c0_seq2:255-1997(-)